VDQNKNIFLPILKKNCEVLEAEERENSSFLSKKVVFRLNATHLLAREYFYRKNRFPPEINELIEGHVLDLLDFYKDSRERRRKLEHTRKLVFDEYVRLFGEKAT
jgi:hypothetical protein